MVGKEGVEGGEEPVAPERAWSPSHQIFLAHSRPYPLCIDKVRGAFYHSFHDPVQAYYQQP